MIRGQTINADGSDEERFNGVAFQAHIEIWPPTVRLAAIVDLEREPEMQSVLILAAAVAAAAAPHPEPQNPGRSQVVTAVENCRQIADNAARLACYDQSVS